MNFAHLVWNEWMKVLRKRRLHVVLAILVVLMVVFSYAELQTAHVLARQIGTSDWHARLQQQLANATNRLHNPFLSDAEKAAIQANISIGQYELAHNINPYAPGAPGFMRTFMDQGMSLLVPLLVTVLAADMVSSEVSGGTVKLLLTRGVSRTRVLASKLAALGLLVALLFLAIAVSAYGVAGLFFGYSGFGLPVIIGFHSLPNGTVDVSHVQLIPQWEYLWMSYGCGFFASLSVACLAFMVSTLVRSTASSMGIMMAALVAGALLTTLANRWTAAKYLPVVNLRLSNYLNGSPPPLEGMTFLFSVTVLAVSALAAVAVSFAVFARRDFLG
ncbi:MAG: ABC transporter permease subunit [Alicyclobacillus sp.]|nr:ABC transporter permease subunit [Alicyclobacillus sp.]